VSTKRRRKAYKVQFVDSIFYIYSALFYLNNLLKCDEVERISSKKLSKILKKSRCFIITYITHI